MRTAATDAAGRLVASLAAAAVAVLGVTAPAAADEPADQRVIVELRPSASLPAATEAEIAEGGTVSNTYHRVFKGFAATLSPERVEALEADPDVRRVAPDASLHALDTQAAPPWGLDRTDQRELPLSSAYTYDTSGAGVTVFVVDTGVRATHTDFGARVAAGWDFVESDSDPSDCNGHGTHVAGTIAGSTYGVAKGATVVPIRVLDCTGSGLVSDALDGFDWAIAHHSGPAVLNFSAGTRVVDAPLDAGAAAVVAAGITFVAAAGNAGTDACASSPGRAADVLTVGASDANDVAASFSNVGDCVDLFAPGVNIVSDAHDSDYGVSTKSGTSMSAPHVAGAVARYLQGDPTAGPATVAAYVRCTATPDAVAVAGLPYARLLYLDPVTAPASDCDAPSTPVVTSAQVEAGGPTLRWDASSDEVGVVGYTVFRGGAAIAAGDLPGAYSDASAVAGTPYTYQVDAYDAAGNHSPRSSAVALTVTPPAAALPVPEPPGAEPAPAAVVLPAGRWSGTGDTVVHLAATRTGRLRIVHTGSGGRFAVWSLGARGGRRQRLVDGTGAYSGTVAYLAGATRRTRVSGFAVEADGPWGMTPRSLASAPVLRTAARGRGDDVLRLRTPTTRLGATLPGRHRFVVVTLRRGGAYDALLLDTVGRRSAVTAVPRPARYVVITADGRWTVRRR